MSHLSLDARAILEYLNELGYRNVSAEQLKEFMKEGMQRNSEISGGKSKQQQKPKESSSSNLQQQQNKLSTISTTPTRLPSPSRQQQQSARTAVKIIKSKKPLCHFKFYLDICDHQVAKKIEIRIKHLGGSLEFFLTPSVTHFITDKTVLPPTVGNNNNTLSSRPGTPQTPLTQVTPQTPYSNELQIVGSDNKNNAINCVATHQQTGQAAATPTPTSASRKAPIRQTRADAILNRARRGQNSSLASIPNSPISSKQTNDLSTTLTGSKTIKCCTSRIDSNTNQQPYVVWQTEQALRFFGKVQHDLKDYLVGTAGTRERKSHSSKSTGACGPTNLKGSFIKIESLKRNYRPYYQLFKKPIEWPKIELTREDGAFRLSPRKEIVETEAKSMTRKSRSRSSQRQQQQHQNVLSAQVQALKKNEIGIKSSAGHKAGSNVAGGGTCKQVKETSEKQCGVCEICKIEYDTLTIHLKTKDHEFFSKNPQNFIALDTLIQTSADVNKFLKDDDENNKTSVNNMELEEMDVEEQEMQSDGETAHDSLDDFTHCNKSNNKQQHSTNSTGLNDVQYNSPSPGVSVRERSKRITKGKHSSEKFQNSLQRRSSKSPKGAGVTVTSTATASPKSSPPKKSTVLKVNTSTANAIKSNANEEPNDETTTLPRMVTRKKQANATSVYSPPIRAMLPPSSLYKVVDTIQDAGTPQRKLQGVEQMTGSPSIIVKFKKVRQPDICRQSGGGDADNMVFRRQRTSSELPTDLDRQTTSDNVRTNNSTASSSSCLDSSANESLGATEIESEKTDGGLSVTTGLNKKAIAIARRRKGKTSLTNKNKDTEQKTTLTTSNKQRFPVAPIQPEVQLKNLRSAKGSIGANTDAITTHADASNFDHATRRLTVPEATRKSSRTATAIVTAATTSSRLLRAAVEAAKKANNDSEAMSLRTLTGRSCNKIQLSNQRTSELIKSRSDAVDKPIGTSKSARSSRLSVVKMEDRMGDSGFTIAENEGNNISLIGRATRNNVKKNITLPLNLNDNADDDEDFEEDDDDDDDGDDGDEDFILKSKNLNKSSAFVTKVDNCPAATREERAARRWNQRMQSIDIPDYLSNAVLEVDVHHDGELSQTLNRSSRRCRVATKVCSPRAKKSKCDSKKVEPLPAVTAKKVILTSPPQRIFDISKSERIPKQRYAFERLPVNDLWYRVYTRQDTCEERYFEYYGSTNYRKLPYEMGPIPFDYTLTGCAAQCMLCQKSGRIHVKPKKAEEKIPQTSASYTKIKHEDQFTLKESKDVSNNMLEESGLNKHSELSQQSTHSYVHKHKKLHLLQRYRQEQHQLMLQKQQQKQQEQQRGDALSDRSSNFLLKCDSKGSTPDREPERKRAGSTHSNTSSCTASSTATFNSKHKYRNKHLSKAAFLSLELPPRKSPREHASTLALVSCIIRQRQDSMSKTNSETDEPVTQAPESPLIPLLPIAEDASSESKRSPIKDEKPPTPLMPAELRSPRATRSAAATPIEELRFATEISENVKRMRRGQNKYDHSPPIVLKTRRPARGKSKKSPVSTAPLDRRSFKVLNSPQTTTERSNLRKDQRRRPRSLLLTSKVSLTRSRQLGRPAKVKGSLPSIRKTGSKKGVLEFEIDAVALKALKGSIVPQKSVKQLEWEIDKYLELTAKDFNCDEISDFCVDLKSEEISSATNKNKSLITTTSSSSSSLLHSSTSVAAKSKKHATAKPMHKIVTEIAENTPPPTDCFSSDFDLYDLFTSSNPSGNGSDYNPLRIGKVGNLSLYNSVALQNYFRKRKSLKSNRTGWPKTQKKKTTNLKHQHELRQKIRFLEKDQKFNVAGKRDNTKAVNIKAELDENAVSTNDVPSLNGEHRRRKNGRENGVITPPDSEIEDGNTVINDDFGDEEYLDAIDETEMMDDVGNDGEVSTLGAIFEDEDDKETMADSIEIERCCTLDGDVDAAAEADIEADADEEDDDDDDEEEDDDNNVGNNKSGRHNGAKISIKRVVDTDDDDTTTMYIGHHSKKRQRRSIEVMSPNSNLRHMNRNSLHADMTVGTASLTSTPTTADATTNLIRGLRRTPVLLNGSLGSCISPSEKAGDNSDIFTVSSDGLDTDLDLSNSHAQYHRTGEEDQQQHQNDTSCPHRTPKRKYDISKYAPNKNSRTCAAEAATAAVKSLAISQFLKKEVRVTCRRLRPPFRRFRFRR